MDEDDHAAGEHGTIMQVRATIRLRGGAMDGKLRSNGIAKLVDELRVGEVRPWAAPPLVRETTHLETKSRVWVDGHASASR